MILFSEIQIHKVWIEVFSVTIIQHSNSIHYVITFGNKLN